MRTINNRVFVATAIIIGTILITHGALALAEFGAATKCDPKFMHVKWPVGWAKWLGCSIASHESLAAGLFGTGGAIFAGWLAYSAVQLQLSDQQNQRLRVETAAKATAVLALTQPAHAAAATLMVLRNAIKDSNAIETELSTLVALGVTHVKNTLEHFSISEGSRELSTSDRLIYLSIVGTLASFVNISTNPSPYLSQQQRWKNQHDILVKLNRYLQAFDEHLSKVYERDSGSGREPSKHSAPAPNSP